MGVMINIVNVNTNDDILHQKSHSKETIRELFGTLVDSGPSATNLSVDISYRGNASLCLQASSHTEMSISSPSITRPPQSAPQFDSSSLHRTPLPLSSSSRASVVAN